MFWIHGGFPSDLDMDCESNRIHRGLIAKERELWDRVNDLASEGLPVVQPVGDGCESPVHIW